MISRDALGSGACEDSWSRYKQITAACTPTRTWPRCARVHACLCVCTCVCMCERERCVHSHHMCTHTDVTKRDRTCRCRVETGARSRQPPPGGGRGGDRVAVILPSSPPHLGVRGSDSPAGNLSVHPSIRSGQNRAWPCDGAPSCLSRAWEV